MKVGKIVESMSFGGEKATSSRVDVCVPPLSHTSMGSTDRLKNVLHRSPQDTSHDHHHHRPNPGLLLLSASSTGSLPKVAISSSGSRSGLESS